MQKLTLGSDGPEVSVLAYGLMSLSGAYGESDDETGLRAIQTALDSGIQFLDTAEAYGGGHNEHLASQVLATRRSDVVIATKFGVRMEGGRMEAQGRPEDARRAIEGSLKRLGTDRVDLYYLHRRDPDVPIEETVGGMARLVEEGKVLHLGLSGVSSETLRRAHAEHAIHALQSEYSLFAREPEGTTLETCRALGIRFVAYSPLGRGILTGALQSGESFGRGDLRSVSPRLQGQDFDANLALVTRLTDLAKQIEVEPAQLALAWIRTQGALPLFGTRQPERIESNARSATIDLSPELCQELSERFPPGAVSGSSLPEDLDHLTEVDAPDEAL